MLASAIAPIETNLLNGIEKKEKDVKQQKMEQNREEESYSVI